MTLPLNIPHVMTARALLERNTKNVPVPGEYRDECGAALKNEALTDGFYRGVEQERGGQNDSRWAFDHLEGRLIELRGGRASAALSFSARLIAQAQRADVPVAWVATGESLFFPPDMRRNGVDIEAMAIVWPQNSPQALRGTDALIRSGGFGLVIVDLAADLDIHPSQQNRLARMAERYGVVVVFLHADFSVQPFVKTTHSRRDIRQKSRHSLRVSLRVEASRRRVSGGDFGCTLRALKDHRHAPGWTIEEVRRGTPGLR